jgi:hypothetical protein
MKSEGIEANGIFRLAFFRFFRFFFRRNGRSRRSPDLWSGFFTKSTEEYMNE